MVSIGYHKPQSSTPVVNAANVNTVSQNDQTSVDNVVATGVAANVAQAVNLPIATSVANLAVSAQIKSEFVQSDVSSTSKPQIIESSVVNRKVASYTVKAEDTIDTVSAKYHITAQTIKWANNMTSDTLTTDSVLRILPFDGVLYTVKDGDTIDSIAKKYSVDKTRLITNNDLEVSGLKSNTSIILPSGVLPETERPGYVAPAPVITYNYYSGSGGGNGYTFGNCTYYAYNRRIQLGLPMSSSWGHAYTWGDAARSTQGFVVSQTPTKGAITQWNPYQGGSGWAGHVGVVESVNESNGSITISEMNNGSYGGYNVVDNRVIYRGDSNWPSNFIK